MEVSKTISASVLSEKYKVSPERVAEFQEKGWTKLEQVLPSEEAGVFKDTVTNAVEMYKTEQRALADRDSYGKAFLQVINLRVKDEEVMRFTMAKRFAGIAADLLGVEKVRIYFDQALYKEAGGGLTP